MPLNLDHLLSRLQGVRKVGKGWIAKCPSHQDRNPSLSIASTDDGKLLIHCFAGCAVAEVASAAGIAISDLFPPGDPWIKPEQRAELAQLVRRADLRACANVLGVESTVVLIAARDLIDGRVLGAEDLARLESAHERISSARLLIGSVK